MSTGAICVNTLKKDWTAETTFSHVLSVIRCLLIVPFPESSLNDEAGKLFMESYAEYSKRAHLMADVHGRKASCSVKAADEKLQKNEKVNDDDEESDPSRPNSTVSESTNPLSSKSANNIKSNGKSLGNKSASKRTSKKKSLKRL